MKNYRKKVQATTTSEVPKLQAIHKELSRKIEALQHTPEMQMPTIGDGRDDTQTILDELQQTINHFKNS